MTRSNSPVNENHYTVCILFSEDMGRILLVQKNRTAYKGMLNGPSGTVEENEDPYDGALREIREETGLEAGDLRSLGTVRLAWLGELRLGDDCKTCDGSNCVLHYFGGIVKTDAVSKIRPADEPLDWIDVSRIVNARPDNKSFAGDGDLTYFTAKAKTLLLPMVQLSIPEKKYAETPNLSRHINHARRELDDAFRNGDLNAASVAASRLARLAYAAWFHNTFDT